MVVGFTVPAPGSTMNENNNWVGLDWHVTNKVTGVDVQEPPFTLWPMFSVANVFDHFVSVAEVIAVLGQFSESQCSYLQYIFKPKPAIGTHQNTTSDTNRSNCNNLYEGEEVISGPLPSLHCRMRIRHLVVVVYMNQKPYPTFRTALHSPRITPRGEKICGVVTGVC